MSFYARMAATAQKQINDKGRPITLRRKSGAYNPATDSFSGTGQTDTTVKAVFTSFTTEEIDGEVILRSDKKVLVAGSEPKAEDILIDGAEQYRIVNVQEIKPGATAILWKCQARK